MAIGGIHGDSFPRRYNRKKLNKYFSLGWEICIAVAVAVVVLLFVWSAKILCLFPTRIISILVQGRDCPWNLGFIPVGKMLPSLLVLPGIIFQVPLPTASQVHVYRPHGVVFNARRFILV